MTAPLPGRLTRLARSWWAHAALLAGFGVFVWWGRAADLPLQYAAYGLSPMAYVHKRCHPEQFARDYRGGSEIMGRSAPVRVYLAAYRPRRSLDDKNLDYYRVRRCVMALVQGVEGQKGWQHPLIVRDLLATILENTGIQIALPA